MKIFGEDTKRTRRIVEIASCKLQLHHCFFLIGINLKCARFSWRLNRRGKEPLRMGVAAKSAWDVAARLYVLQIEAGVLCVYACLHLQFASPCLSRLGLPTRTGLASEKRYGIECESDEELK